MRNLERVGRVFLATEREILELGNCRKYSGGKEKTGINAKWGVGLQGRLGREERGQWR